MPSAELLWSTSSSLMACSSTDRRLLDRETSVPIRCMLLRGLEVKAELRRFLLDQFQELEFLELSLLLELIVLDFKSVCSSPFQESLFMFDESALYKVGYSLNYESLAISFSMSVRQLDLNCAVSCNLVNSLALVFASSTLMADLSLSFLRVISAFSRPS